MQGQNSEEHFEGLSDYAKKASKGLLSNKYLKEGQEALKNDELERIIKKSEDLIICEVPKQKCEVRGDYWKCYMGNYVKCPIYLNFLKKHL